METPGGDLCHQMQTDWKPEPLGQNVAPPAPYCPDPLLAVKWGTGDSRRTREWDRRVRDGPRVPGDRNTRNSPLQHPVDVSDRVDNEVGVPCGDPSPIEVVLVPGDPETPHTTQSGEPKVVSTRVCDLCFGP